MGLFDEDFNLIDEANYIDVCASEDTQKQIKLWMDTYTRSSFTKKNGAVNYKINGNGYINVYGNCIIVTKGNYNLFAHKKFDANGKEMMGWSGDFPYYIKFGFVKGNFICTQMGLTKLEGAPKKVYGEFNCSNNKLKSLKNGPFIVNNSYICAHNKLRSLKGLPISLKELNIVDNPIIDNIIKKAGINAECVHLFSNR